MSDPINTLTVQLQGVMVTRLELLEALKRLAEIQRLERGRLTPERNEVMGDRLVAATPTPAFRPGTVVSLNGVSPPPGSNGRQLATVVRMISRYATSCANGLPPGERPGSLILYPNSVAVIDTNYRVYGYRAYNLVAVP